MIFFWVYRNIGISQRPCPQGALSPGGEIKTTFKQDRS